ncbi:nodulation protein NfeD [Bacteroidetes/Chlorobi group bacterium ChocPot_Mid]|nr:MAG: nodulation protein NfeD [Bacteroidetes/Chlorobi group bacterium ChocPot_Mid]
MKSIINTILFLLIFASVSFAKNKVIMIDINSGIGPATAEYIHSAIKYSEEQQAEALIIKLNTPGGLLESTRGIVSNLLSSEVPVVVYVAPAGARAGSAGVFITLAANVAVMAPGTNIGAAHPVGLGGQSDTNSAMTDKITNDASAFMRTIAKKRNRNVEWAELTVRKSISATENEALDSGAIDFICPNIDSLLTAINGLSVELQSTTFTINTNNVEIENYEQSWRMKLLALISDPNIAYLLLMLGIYGIFFELYNPGSIFPGVIGGISIILAAYSLQMMPVNYAGLALILLAVVLFLLEIKVPSYGMLTIGGVISILLGSLMLIEPESELEFVSISMSLIITVVILTALFFIFIAALGIKAQSKKDASGKEGLISEIGVALTDFDAKFKGKVRVHGEIWNATSDDNIKEGDEIIVSAVKNMVLSVKRK